MQEPLALVSALEYWQPFALISTPEYSQPLVLVSTQEQALWLNSLAQTDFPLKLPPTERSLYILMPANKHPY